MKRTSSDSKNENESLKNEPDSKEILVLITSPQGIAVSIAKTLLAEYLAACVNVIPSIQSIYRWEGTIHDEMESLLMVKTNERIWKVFKARLEELHPYETPEIIAFDISTGNEQYLNWLNAQLIGTIGENQES